MEKVYRFAAKNKTLFSVLMILFLCGTYTSFCLLIQAPAWLTVTINVVCLLFVWVFPDAASGMLIDLALKELNDRCDPIPLLREAETQLTYQNNEAQKVMLSMSRGAALALLGEMQHYYDILTSINIDKSPSILLPTKFSYYSDLSSLCIDLGDMEQAKIWNAKARVLYEDIKEETKESCRFNYEMLQADQFLLNEEFHKAYEVARTLQAKTLLTKVEKAFFCSKLQLKLGDLEGAKVSLQFVITYGNKLYFVQEAKELMEQHGL